MVAVFVMDGQKMTVLIFELPSAFCTDRPMYFERLFPVITCRNRSLFKFPGDFLRRFLAATYLPEISEPSLPHKFFIVPLFFVR